MNRIILIGNGFDLAHGLKTSYRDFIDNFWEKITKKIFNVNEIYEDDNIKAYRRYNVYTYQKGITLKDYTRYGIHLTYKNKFLQKITEKNYLQNWVDIENEYYNSLLELMKSTNDLPITTRKEKYTIQKLNQEFKTIQNALEEYLTELLNTEENKSHNFFNPYIFSEIKSDINPLELSTVGIEEFIKNEVSKGMSYNDVKNKINSYDYIGYSPKNILFLSFNYTCLENNYVNNGYYMPSNTQIIHIHGKLNNTTDNKIIFGYGDEIDENYKKIENLNDNDYLQNVKSIKYLESKSYKEMLDFINSDAYQVFIFGHSCGISDRTLLNTIFEHSNCQSIKPYYYKKSEIEDNYSNIIRDISRNFTNKASMRDKVVNKTYTKPLNG